MPLASGPTFADVFEQSANPSALLDLELRFVGANAAYLRLTGLEWGTILNASLFDVLAIPDAARLRESVGRVLASKGRDDLTIVRYGNELVVNASIASVQDSAGAVRWLLHQIVEVTDMRVDEQQLALLHRVFEQAPGFAAILRGPDHRVALGNRAYFDLIGRDTSVIGKTVAEAIPEVIDQGFIALLDRVYRSGEPFIGRRVAIDLLRGGERDRRIVDFVNQPIRLGDETVAIFALGQDITEATQREVTSARVSAQYRELVELAPEQIWTATTHGELDFVNRYTAEYFGVERTSLLGSRWATLLHADDRETAMRRWAQSVAMVASYRQDFRLRRADGEYRWHRALATPVYEANGKLAGWIGVNTDVHDARMFAEYENKLVEVISHDLRNPLAAISLALPMLYDEPLGKDGRNACGHVARAASRAERLLIDLADFAEAHRRSMPITPVMTSLTSLIETAIDAATLTAGKREITIAHDGPRTGVWDETRLVQLLTNLIANAIEHAPADAPIHVSSRIVDDTATIAVFNRGSFISDEARVAIFDPFTRTVRPKRGRSIGLGLYIARAIARAHGGDIDVESSPDHGTTFTVTLPTSSQL